jgi:hypothetical protein
MLKGRSESLSKFTPILAVLLFFLLGTLWESYTGQNADNSKTNEIQRLLMGLPFYPNTKEAHGRTRMASGHKAYISQSYRCEADYGEIKRFFLSELGVRGWEFSGEDVLSGKGGGAFLLRFRRGEYELSIESLGEKARDGWGDEYEWDYSIGIDWKP